MAKFAVEGSTLVVQFSLTEATIARHRTLQIPPTLVDSVSADPRPWEWVNQNLDLRRSPLEELGGGAEEDAMTDDHGDGNRTAQVAVYTEIGSNYRAMDDLRLRLLALLPLATGAGIVVLLGGHGVSAAIDVPVGLFGMVATISLYFYELHGIEKCAHYIDAGAKLEADFNVRGSFTNRPHGVFGGVIVSELLPAALIYPASFTGWLFLALYHVGNIARGVVTGTVFIVLAAASRVIIRHMENSHNRQERRANAWHNNEHHDTLGQEYDACTGQLVAPHQAREPFKE